MRTGSKSKTPREPLLSIQEAQRRLGFKTRKPVDRAIERGDLEAYLISGSVRIEPNRFEDWIAANKIRPRSDDRPTRQPPSKASRPSLRKVLESTNDQEEAHERREDRS